MDHVRHHSPNAKIHGFADFDGGIGIIFRHQPHPFTLDLQAFYGEFAIQHADDDFTGNRARPRFTTKMSL